MKQFIFTIALISFCLLTNAQSFNFGLSGGLIGSQVNGDQFRGYNKLGFMGGISVNRTIYDNDFQMEFNFIQKGSRKNQNPDAGDFTTYIMRLNYIEIPVLYKYKLHQHLSIHGGLKLAYLINSKEFDNYGLITANPGIPDFRDFDYSVFAGMDIPLKNNWSAIFRFTYSIRAIRPTPSNTVYYLNRGQYNEVLTLGLQYQFNGKKN